MYTYRLSIQQYFTDLYLFVCHVILCTFCKLDKINAKMLSFLLETPNLTVRIYLCTRHKIHATET